MKRPYLTVLALTLLGFLCHIDSYSQTVMGQEKNDFLPTDLVLRDLCRVKGQEENVLQGLGLVVGLKGSGDTDVATARGLAQTMKLMGGQIGVDTRGIMQIKELKDAKNVASVIVTAKIPANGAQQGDRLDCTVSAISAKSLEGGTLLLTPLLGPRPDRPTVYALAQGPIVLEDAKILTNAKVQGGCKMEATVMNEFLKGNIFTLVLDPSQSSFSTAQSVAETINQYYRTLFSSPGANNSSITNLGERIAQAKDQSHIEVKVPNSYREQPVSWIAEILDQRLHSVPAKKRVVIQERTGVIVIGDDVTIAPVAIAHKNLTISAKGNGGGSFVGIDPTNPLAPPPANTPSPLRPRLQHLVDSLNRLAVPTEDTIAIIKALKRQGNLYGELVIE